MSQSVWPHVAHFTIVIIRVYVNKISIQNVHLFCKFSIKMTVIKADETVSKGFSVPSSIAFIKIYFKSY